MDKFNNDLIDFANYLTDIASKISKKYFRNTENLKKNDSSSVTITDREIEEVLKKEISLKYGHHSIYGEETENIIGSSDYSWYIDPIDGTDSFISGKPLFTNLIAICFKNEPIFGIINQPIIGERWQGGQILGYSTFNGKKIKVRDNLSSLSEVIFSTTSPYYFNKEQLRKIDIIRKKTKYQRGGGVFFGGDAY